MITSFVTYSLPASNNPKLYNLSKKKKRKNEPLQQSYINGANVKILLKAVSNFSNGSFISPIH